MEEKERKESDFFRVVCNEIEMIRAICVSQSRPVSLLNKYADVIA